MFTKKLKQKIQSLEAQVRGLSDENQQLVIERNQARFEADVLRKAVEMYQRKEPVRNEKGQFVKKQII